MTDGMSRSRKKFPAGVVCGCKSQKRGKQVASKRFRRRVRLPYRSTELTSPWDLGGDGKCFYGYHPDKEWYAKIMRK